MALLAVLQSDPLSRAKLDDALGDRHELLECQDWDCLWEATEAAPLDGCIVDVYVPDRPTGLRELQRLRKLRPTLAIMVYADFSGREMDLFVLGRLKVDAVLLAGEDESPTWISDAVGEGLVTSLASRVTAALGPRLPPPGPDILRWAIESAHKGPRTKDLAEAFGHTPGSLGRMLRSKSLPSASRFLVWGRLFRAAHLLDDPRSSVERVAYVVGYSSGAALSRGLRRRTGHPPRELRKRGVLASVVDAYVRREGQVKKGSEPSWSRARRKLGWPPTADRG